MVITRNRRKERSGGLVVQCWNVGRLVALARLLHCWEGATQKEIGAFVDALETSVRLVRNWQWLGFAGFGREPSDKGKNWAAGTEQNRGAERPGACLVPSSQRPWLPAPAPSALNSRFLSQLPLSP